MMSLVQETWRHWRANNTTRMGAALSYYAMLSFVPLILLIISAATMLFSRDVVENTVMHHLVVTIGSNAALYISEVLHNSQLQDISLRAALLSGLILMIGALGVFSELDRDLDELWQVVQKEVQQKKSFVKRIGVFLHSKVMLLSVLPVLVVLLGITIAITLFLSFVQTKTAVLPQFGTLITFFQVFVPLILSTLLFTIVYRILPNRKLPWSVLFVGALVTASLFIIGNILIAIYIKLLVHTSIFGQASSLVGLLVWIYYSSQVFFLGASFTFVYAKHKGYIESISSRERVQ